MLVPLRLLNKPLTDYNVHITSIFISPLSLFFLLDTDDPGSWRGRAEQITILKQKITELQQVITNLQEQQRCTQRNSQETDKIYNHRVSHRGQDDSACTTHRSDGDSVSPHNAYDEGKSDKACEGDSERLPTSSRPPLPPHSRRMMRPYSQPSSFTAVPTSLPDNNKHPSSRGPNRLSALNSKRTLLGNAPLTPNTLYPNNTTSTTTSLDNLLHGIYPPAFMAELEAKDLLISREKQKLHVAKARIQSLETQVIQPHPAPLYSIFLLLLQLLVWHTPMIMSLPFQPVYPAGFTYSALFLTDPCLKRPYFRSNFTSDDKRTKCDAIQAGMLQAHYSIILYKPGKNGFYIVIFDSRLTHFPFISLSYSVL